MSLINTYEFKKCVNRYNSDRHAIKFTCCDKFIVMSFAQFTDRSRLKDIKTTLNLYSPTLYRSSIKTMPKSTLAEANEKKGWRIYQNFAHVLIRQAKEAYKGQKLRLDEMVYALDSSTIEQCLKWARFHHEKRAIKMHALMDFRVSIPTFTHLTEGVIHDSKIMDKISVKANSYCLMDKGYVKFDSLFQHLHLNNTFL